MGRSSSRKTPTKSEIKRNITLERKLHYKSSSIDSNRTTIAGVSLTPLIYRPPKNSNSQKKICLSSRAWKWNDTNDLLMYRFGTPINSNLVAGFDFDGCLVKTSLYCRQPEAWSVLFPKNTQSALQELSENGFKIVILSNQGGIGRAKKSKSAEITKVQTRIAGFISLMQHRGGTDDCEPCKKTTDDVNIPIDVLISTNSSSGFHKPRGSMWDFFKENLNGNMKIDMEKSFYVGDAAGRRTDFADSDSEFAKNVGLKFFNEQQFFLHSAYKKLL